MREPIRVLHILQRMEAGGTQALLMNIYRNIDRKKVQFDFLVEYPDKQFYDEEILKLGGRIYYTTVRQDFNILKFNKELEKVLTQNNYKIVHVHTYSIGYFVLKTAEKCGVQIRIAHSHSNEAVRDYKYFLKLIMQRIYTIHANQLFACSEEAGKYLFKDRPFKILRNAIDSPKFVFNQEIRDAMREKLGISKNFVVGHVGRFKKEKNHIFLIDVFSKIKKNKENAKLILVGTGPLEVEIKEKIKKLKLENDVIFLGNRDNVNEIYQAMDIMVFPSLFEGLGIVAIESQAAGTPILCSDKLPKEVEITELLKKKSLDNSIEEWACEAIDLALTEKAKKNMRDKIISEGFDIVSIANNLQQYYIEKYNLS